jgi:sulfatase modifying factor 1
MLKLGKLVLLGLASCLTGCAAIKHTSPILSIGSEPNNHRLIMIPAGRYQAGADGNRGNPRHNVELKQFWISDAETTNEQFSRFVRRTGYKTSAERRGYGMVALEGMLDWAWAETPVASWRWPHGPKGRSAASMPKHPVTQISGQDAEAYCRWVGGRLPTLDEWEIAARAGATTRWPWGDIYLPAKANIWNGEDHRRNTGLDGWCYTSPVRAFPPNAWGLYDVIGNVFEYCSDLPASFPASDSARLIAGRGGSWWCSANTCNFYNLEDIGTMARDGSLSNQGFRVVFDSNDMRQVDQ